MRLLGGKAWNLRGSPKNETSGEDVYGGSSAVQPNAPPNRKAEIGPIKRDQLYEEQKEESLGLELDEDEAEEEEKDSCSKHESKSQEGSESMLHDLCQETDREGDTEEDEALNIEDDDESDDEDSEIAPSYIAEHKEQEYSGPENGLDAGLSKEDDDETDVREDRDEDGPVSENESTNIVSQQDLILSEEEVQEMWAGKSNVLVAVRVRPMNGRELAQSRNVVKVLDRRLVVVLSSAKSNDHREVDVLRQNRSRDKRYAFDFAFGPETETSTVYKNTTQFLIDGVVYGYNATVFAYGATGAGKTYTMLGDVAGADENKQRSPGIMLLTLQDLFKRIELFGYSTRQTAGAFQTFSNGSIHDKSDFKKAKLNRRPFSATTPSGGTRQYRVTCSFLEVYNEMIRDLLTPSSEYLDLREDPVKGPTVTGLSEVEAFSAEDIMQLLRKGNSRRSTEGTAANEASSRSHAVLQVTIERQDDGIGNGAVSNVTIGKLSLIDLAGSERASVTQNRGQRLVEGANINRSLLALGNCINALREGGKGAFVPYRDSKLTRLLKDSLGGNCRTVMIAAVSPAKNQRDETLNTLKYANRAKNIKTQVERNVLNVDYHVSEYVNLIDRLKTEISTLRGRLKHPIGAAVQDFAIDKQKLDSAPSGDNDARTEKKTLVRKKVEKQQMALLREQLVLNFKERMQLRRSLIEIEAQNIANNNELEMLRPTLTRWAESLERRIQKQNGTADDEEEGELEHSSHSEFDREDDEGREQKESQAKGKRKRLKKPLKVVTEPETVRSARCEISQLERANMKNCQQKLDIERRLKENEDASAAVRRQMETRITSEERRELMELEYRIGMLELENMELERSRMVHRSCMSHKDMLIKRLFSQLELRDTIIDEQKKLLCSNGVGSEAVECALEAHIEELEPLHMLESLPTGAPPTPGTATPRFHKERVQSHGPAGTRNGITPSAFGLPSPANDRPMFPLERLEEELMRIEISNEYVPSPDYGRRKSQISQSTHNTKAYGTRLKGGGMNGNKAERDKRKMRRLQSSVNGMHVLLPTGHVSHKKAHPYLRHQRLGRSRTKVRSQSSNVPHEDAGSRYNTPNTGMRMAPMSPPRRSARDVKGSIGKARTKKKVLLKSKGSFLKQPNEYGQHRRPPTSPSIASDAVAEKVTNTSSHISLHNEAKVSRKHRSTYHNHASSSIPNQEPVDKGKTDSSPKANSAQQHEEFQLPPLATTEAGESSTQRKDSYGPSNKLEKVKGVAVAEPLQRPSSQGESRATGQSHEVSRSTITSDTPRASTPEGKGSQSQSLSVLDRKQTLERLNSRLNKEVLEVSQTSEGESGRSQLDKALRKERKRLCRKWGELSFVLRHVIESDQDIIAVQESAQSSLKFLHQLDRKASELKVLRGTLSRMLLPYSENTAAATQRANTPVTGDSPLDSVMDLKTRKQMVASANQLRSLVRVKIADDADLDQAKLAVEEALTFFQKLDEFSTKVDKPRYEVLHALGAPTSNNAR